MLSLLNEPLFIFHEIDVGIFFVHLSHFFMCWLFEALFEENSFAPMEHMATSTPLYLGCNIARTAIIMEIMLSLFYFVLPFFIGFFPH